MSMKNSDTIGNRSITAPPRAPLGAVYGHLIVYMPPVAVHRNFLSALKGTKNLISLPLGRS
jgi:hypothetical protein